MHALRQSSTYRLFIELILISILIAFMSTMPKPAYGQSGSTTADVPGGPPDIVFKVSSAAGTYIQMAQQIASVCPRPSLEISPSAGQLALYNDLVTNKANMGLLTAPVLFGKKTIEGDINVDKIVVVMPMYIAEMHTVVLRSNAQINQFSDVGNKRVGTFGGAFITTRIVLGQANIRPVSLQDYKTEDLALGALQKGEVDVVFIEVGQPATWAVNLNGSIFKFIPFDRQDLMGRNGFVQATLNYPNVSQSAVKTLGTQVYLVSQNYTGKKKVDDISALKNCITQNIDTLRETTGYHAKWSQVNPQGKSDWPMFKTSQVSNQAAKKQQKKQQ